MRLTQTQIKIITEKAKQHYGKEVHVYLFGSRTDDRKKGGDIDILIVADARGESFQKKLEFLIDLKKKLGDRKIDVVYGHQAKANPVFYETINKSRQQLC